MEQNIKDDLYALMENLIITSNGKICVHDVCLRILNLMEKHGESLDIDLVNSLMNASNGDKETLEWLKRYRD